MPPTLSAADITALRAKAEAWQRGTTVSPRRPYEFRGGPLDGLRLMLGLGHDPEFLAIAHLLEHGLVQVMYRRQEGRAWAFEAVTDPPAAARAAS